MRTPEVSVVIPVYNSSQYIEQAIESALIQKVDLEIIVIDDGSTDNLDLIISKYKDFDNFIYIKNSLNLGVAESRNKGVRAAKGKYIAFLDADDCWRECKLLEQLKFMKENGHYFTYTARSLVNQVGHPLKKVLQVKSTTDYKSLLYHNCIACSSVVISRDVIIKFPMEHSEYHEDYILWLKILRENGNAYGINQPYLIYRLNKHGKSYNKFSSVNMTFKTYRTIGLCNFEAIIYTSSHLIHGIKKYFM